VSYSANTTSQVNTWSWSERWSVPRARSVCC